jgi:acylphosphatase
MNAMVHVIVSGLVQGVGFRFFVHRQASALGVKGWVRNLYNGDVEIEVEGDKLILEHFVAEIQAGPRAAWVKNVVLNWREEPGKYTGFEIR